MSIPSNASTLKMMFCVIKTIASDLLSGPCTDASYTLVLYLLRVTNLSSNAYELLSDFYITSTLF